VIGLLSAKDLYEQLFLLLQSIFQLNVEFRFTQPLLRNACDLRPRSAGHRTAGVLSSLGPASRPSKRRPLQVVTKYWAVVQAQGDLEVERKSLELLTSPIKSNKRALELGALPPLEIYRRSPKSRPAEFYDQGRICPEARRRMSCACQSAPTLDPYSRPDLELTEKPDVEGDPRSMDVASALGEALKQRPELLAARYSLDNDGHQHSSRAQSP